MVRSGRNLTAGVGSDHPDLLLVRGGLLRSPPGGIAGATTAAGDRLFGEDEVVVTASIGITLSTIGNRQAEDVIRDADTA
jgi:hypothetical protein